jgi:hypothetical protein
MLEEAPTEEGKRLAITVGDDEIAWYLYFNDLNAFAYCVAQEAGLNGSKFCRYEEASSLASH